MCYKNPRLSKESQVRLHLTVLSLRYFDACTEKHIVVFW